MLQRLLLLRLSLGLALVRLGGLALGLGRGAFVVLLEPFAMAVPVAEAGDRQGADAHDLGQGQLAQRQALLLRRFGSLGHERDPCRAMRQPSSQSRHGLHWANTAATAA